MAHLPGASTSSPSNAPPRASRRSDPGCAGALPEPAQRGFTLTQRAFVDPLTATVGSPLRPPSWGAATVSAAWPATSCDGAPLARVSGEATWSAGLESPGSAARLVGAGVGMGVGFAGAATVMMTGRLDDSRPVSGSRAVSVNSLPPFWTGTLRAQRPSSPASSDWTIVPAASSALTVAWTGLVPVSWYEVWSSSARIDRSAIQAQLRDLGEPEQLHPDVAQEQDDHDAQDRRDREAGREGEPATGVGQGLRGRDHGGARRPQARVLLLVPAIQHLHRVEPQVERVVAQEALGIDRAGQLRVVAVLECRQVPGADLGVALRTVEVDALLLAGRVQHVSNARRRRRVDGRALTSQAAADACLLAGGHALRWSPASNPGVTPVPGGDGGRQGYDVRPVAAVGSLGESPGPNGAVGGHPGPCPDTPGIRARRRPRCSAASSRDRRPGGAWPGSAGPAAPRCRPAPAPP